MILADTSVWIENFRRPLKLLLTLAQQRKLLMHPLIIGELAMGSLPRRSEVLRELARMNRSRIATHREVLVLVEEHQLWGRGLGFIDASLLASVVISSEAKLWTLDRRLRDAARDRLVAFEPD